MPGWRRWQRGLLVGAAVVGWRERVALRGWERGWEVVARTGPTPATADRANRVDAPAALVLSLSSR